MTLARAVILLLMASPAAADMLRVDARGGVPVPETGYLKLGSARAPNGSVIGINNRYLTLDGQPWLPVMGEFHYVRTPKAEWDAELAKIKASGVDIVATYLMWDYHEEVEGRFDWSGDRDLRAFVAAAARHGLKVFLRLGPWVHAEVRFGGIPDWVVRSMPTRRDDPVYLRHVERFWAQAHAQVQGQMWKDGGPVIGIQIENEYNLRGAGQGAGHIATLKAMAVRLGFDVPLYSVTGWDQTVYPAREVTPVFGGYPDEPWGRATTKLPPKETYAFRFGSRVSGDLGAQTRSGRVGDAEADIAHTPFLGAEYGGGIPTMYRRRPVMQADDIAAMLPVQLGSGVNLYGYYMYHGGRNAIGRTTLQESTAIGGHNDLPIVDYDFQAPFGQYGAANPVLPAIRPFHLFLNAWGSVLAPMAVRRPDVVPSGPADLATPRFSVRSAGDSAFLFWNGHVRQYATTTQRSVRFTVELPGGPVTFPAAPIDIPAGRYFIWPVNMALGTTAARLAWATAQPLTTIATPTGNVTLLQAIPGIPLSLAIRGGRVRARGASMRREGQVTVVSGLKPGTETVVDVTDPAGRHDRLVVLTQEQARRVSKVTVAGTERLVMTEAEVTPTANGLHLVSRGDPRFTVALFPAPAVVVASLPLARTGRDGVFTRYTATAPIVRQPQVTVTPLRPATSVPPVPIGGPARAAVEPYPESFAAAASWTLAVPPAAGTVEDRRLVLRWTGDIGRLFAGTDLIDDRYYDGRAWQVNLNRFAARLDQPLTLSILPLRKDAPIYLDEAAVPKPGGADQVATLDHVAIETDYGLDLRF
jgi:hypothetical protein